MDLIDLITQNPIAFIAVASLSFNIFFLRRLHINTEKIGTLQSSITHKDHEFQRLFSEWKDMQEVQKNAIINIKKEYERKLSDLTKENAKLTHNEALRNSNVPNSFEPDWH